MKTLHGIVEFVCFEIAAVGLLLGSLTMFVRLLGPTLWAVAATLALYGCFIVGTATTRHTEGTR